MSDANEIVLSHTQLVWSLVHRFKKSFQQVRYSEDDLFQEAISVVLRKWSKFNPDLAGPSTFIYKLVLNCFRDLLEKEMAFVRNVPEIRLSEFETNQNESEVSPYTISVDMPVDAVVMEKELHQELNHILPEDAKAYMEVCLNPPLELIYKSQEEREKRCGCKFKEVKLEKQDIINHLAKQGGELWAKKAGRKLRSALRNRFPNTLQKKFNRSMTTSC